MSSSRTIPMAVAMDMSFLQIIMLDDNGVSRMMAGKALLDQAFKKKLLDFVSSSLSITSPRTEEKNPKVIVQTIKEFRAQILNQAGLHVPHCPWRFPRHLDTIYLQKTTTSGKLLVKANPQKEGWTEAVSEEDNYKRGWAGSPMCVARLAVAFLQSALRFQADPTPFPLERLPSELRLQVYREVLRGAAHGQVACTETIIVTRTQNNDFQFRFRHQRNGDSKEIYTSLLAANKLVNIEAIPVLYQSRTFDFMTNVGNVMPFLRSLSHEARQILHGIAMELNDKQEPDYCCGGVKKSWGKGPDNQRAWNKACAYIAENVNVKQLHLTINLKVPTKFRSLQWVKVLVKIKSLRYLTLRADQHSSKHPLVARASYKEGSVLAAEHCFSEHLVPLFEYLREEMLEGKTSGLLAFDGA